MATETEFAGFTYPRKIAQWTGKGTSIEARQWGTARYRVGKASPWCFVYYLNRPPMAGTGAGGYLGENGWPHLRWQWCDECDDAPNHVRRNNGWYADPNGMGETIRGIVLRLPRSRGFLAGWSMGEGMASTVDGELHATERDAARAADQMAEHAAEDEREYQAGWRAGLAAAEARATALAEALETIEAARVMRDAARKAITLALAARSGEEVGVLPPDTADRYRRLYVESLTRARDKAEAACEARALAWRAWREARAYGASQWAAGFREGAA